MYVSGSKSFELKLSESKHAIMLTTDVCTDVTSNQRWACSIRVCGHNEVWH